MTPAVARLRVLAACLLLTALSFSQSPSRVVPDTKLDLVVDPVRFLSRALHLWEPEGAFGQLQNQAYGYLFPMGPFFALGRLLELPGWVVQRAWLAAILVVALLGTVRLAERMGIGSDGTRLLAGLAYALSPRVLSVAGPISIEALPLAVLPWVLLPLVTGAQGGSERRAAARSGLAVLCIGGVNAAATLAVLPLPALFLLLRLGTPRGRRLAAWWAGAVTLAGLWWALPLLLLGRYSLPFLDFIETAEVTTAHTSLVEVLRGTSDWLAYLSVAGEPWWRAAHQLVTQPVLILQTAVLAALGLAGLLRRDAPHRSLLLGGVLLGTSLVTLGHVGDLPGWATPPLGAPVRELLDGALAPFRNVHKFDAVLRLPLVLGLAHLAASLRVPTPAVPPVG
ncbi:MAG: coagulation factor 5/8 type domain protein, partial [Frankiales bacterium]|nr:coagulation factor 5/8 type domain protein [Frankiales bacterium]